MTNSITYRTYELGDTVKIFYNGIRYDSIVTEVDNKLLDTTWEFSHELYEFTWELKEKHILAESAFLKAAHEQVVPCKIKLIERISIKKNEF